MKSIFKITLLLLLVGAYGVAQSKKPNVLIILSDDQGWGDTGFNGATDIPTPNLDKLAKDGVIFSHGYAAHSYCSPSRAGLLTGRYQHRFGHENNPSNEETEENKNIGLDLNETLISNVMKNNGYQTCAIGKWHLGNSKQFWPTSRGFDDWFGFSPGGLNYWGVTGNKPKMFGVLRNGVPVPQNELTYITDDFTNEAVKYIDKYSKNENPFFMYLAYNAPHGPIQATKQYTDMVKYIEDGQRAAYCAMVAGMDTGIGKVIKKLKDIGEYENTIIVFYSDNGGHHNGASNLPFRGNKGALFEGGIRVPFVMSWPKKIKGGRIYSEPIIALDVFPTILDAAGIKHPKPSSLDGIDLFPVLKSGKELKQREPLFWRYSDGIGYAVLDGDYKMVRSEFKQKKLLFNLTNDPYEHNDLAEAMPQKVVAMQKLFDVWSITKVKSRWPDAHIVNIHKTENERKEYIRKATSGDKANK